MPLFTIGHSNHQIERFIELLRMHTVDTLIDVRSVPTSRWHTQFDRASLESALGATGIIYCYMGNLLGGRLDGDDLYDQRGYANYDAFSNTSVFKQGIQKVLDVLGQERRVALMCAEEDPKHCHRRLLIARHLFDHYGIDAVHIRRDGTCQTESELRRATTPSLFDDDPDWSQPAYSSRPIPGRARRP